MEGPQGVKPLRKASGVLRQLKGASRDFRQLRVYFREVSAGTSRSRRDLQKLWQWKEAMHLSKHVPLTCTPQSCPEAKRNRWRLNEGVGRDKETQIP